MSHIYRRAFSSVVVVALLGTALLLVSLQQMPSLHSEKLSVDRVESMDSSGLSPAELVVHTPRVVVLKEARRLYLYDGDELVRVYQVNVGQNPRSGKVRDGDMRTPIGRFKVVTKNPDSPYHRFLGINYPHEQAVASGLSLGLITEGEAEAIRSDLREGRCPNWSTALGGGIGLHGGRVGRGTTAGCVAVSDQHIEELFNILRVGDPIEIWP